MNASLYKPYDLYKFAFYVVENQYFEINESKPRKI